MINKEYKDVDPQETLEWIESIKSIIDTAGAERTHFILGKLIGFAR